MCVDGQVSLPSGRELICILILLRLLSGVLLVAVGDGKNQVFVPSLLLLLLLFQLSSFRCRRSSAFFAVWTISTGSCWLGVAVLVPLPALIHHVGNLIGWRVEIRQLRRSVLASNVCNRTDL